MFNVRKVFVIVAIVVGLLLPMIGYLILGYQFGFIQGHLSGRHKTNDDARLDAIEGRVASIEAERKTHTIVISQHSTWYERTYQFVPAKTIVFEINGGPVDLKLLPEGGTPWVDGKSDLKPPFLLSHPVVVHDHLGKKHELMLRIRRSVHDGDLMLRKSDMAIDEKTATVLQIKLDPPDREKVPWHTRLFTLPDTEIVIKVKDGGRHLIETIRVRVDLKWTEPNPTS